MLFTLQPNEISTKKLTVKFFPAKRLLLAILQR